MKYLRILLLSVFTLIFLSSCVYQEDLPYKSNYRNGYTLEDIISNYDLWYVDIHKTEGSESVPFIEKAFTITFLNGIIYANNNIVNIGKTGRGLGIEIGSYNTSNDVLKSSHRDGFSDFEVVELSNNEIRLDDLNQNVSYYLVGYQRNKFDYDKVFYENIEFFLQEYEAWERIKISEGEENIFDNEHFLEFSSDRKGTFRSSNDRFGTDIDNIFWNNIGRYEIKDYTNVDNIKHLTLFYNNNDTETFDLIVINNNIVKLKHIKSNSFYTFAGRNFTQYLRSSNVNGINGDVLASKNSNRKRKIIKRKKLQKHLK